VGKEYLERCIEMTVRPLTLLFWLFVLVPVAQAELASPIPQQVNPALQLKLPEGFKAEMFASMPAEGAGPFQGPRFMTFGPDGNLYLSLGLDNKVVMLPDRDKDGKADSVVTVSDKLNGPQGLAFVDNMLYVANQDGVVRLEQRGGTWPAASVTPFINNLPAGGHTLKTLRVGPDRHFYINVGSSCNVCDENDPLRATMLRYTLEGKPAGALVTVGRHAPSPIWARGLRNTQGFAWQPGTGAMYATNNGSDMRSGTKSGKPDDDLPPEHFNLLEAGKHYGWPYCWGERVTDPNFPGPDGFCKGVEAPAITFPAHSTPVGMSFLDKASVPADYRDDALIALHGSWNRSEPSGYKLVRVHFEQGRPVRVSDFATGLLRGDEAWGRPVDVIVGPAGDVYVSDDRAGLIYRITYKELK
jgi:glucose/arabinose dehydrogenase